MSLRRHQYDRYYIGEPFFIGNTAVHKSSVKGKADGIFSVLVLGVGVTQDVSAIYEHKYYGNSARARKFRAMVDVMTQRYLIMSSLKAADE